MWLIPMRTIRKSSQGPVFLTFLRIRTNTYFQILLFQMDISTFSKESNKNVPEISIHPLPELIVSVPNTDK